MIYNKADGFSLSDLGKYDSNQVLQGDPDRFMSTGMANAQQMKSLGNQTPIFDAGRYADWDQRAGFHQDATKKYAGMTRDQYEQSLDLDPNQIVSLPDKYQGENFGQLMTLREAREKDPNFDMSALYRQQFEDGDDRYSIAPIFGEDGTISDINGQWLRSNSERKGIRNGLISLAAGGALYGSGALSGLGGTTAPAVSGGMPNTFAQGVAMGGGVGGTTAGGLTLGSIGSGIKTAAGALGIKNLGDALKIGGKAIGALDQRNKNEQGQENLDKNFEPYREQARGYMGRLQETYDNPNSYLEGPEYQAAQRIYHNKISRADAARGLNANGTGREKLMQDHAFDSLDKYRQGLSRNVLGLGQIATGNNSTNSILNNQGKNQPMYDFIGSVIGDMEINGDEGGGEMDTDALDKLIENLIGGM